MNLKTPSPYQIDIFEEIKKAEKNILINATAGSGKTTTLVNSLELVPRFKKTLFSAFNKSIADELRTRVPNYIHVYTLHSLGFSLIRKNKPNSTIKLNEWKYFRTLKEFVDSKDDIADDFRLRFTHNLKKIYELYRMTLSKPILEEIELICFKYDIPIDGLEPKYFLEILPSLEKMNTGFRKEFSVDYTDMVYLPVFLGIAKPSYDFIFVDEAQDLNKCQQEMLFNLVKKNGNIVACGDPYQSIYGFAGSDINSFNRFKEHNNTIMLPLSISYRCATNIVAEAQSVNKEIMPFEKNDPGVVRKGSWKEASEGDFVLCRNVQPLIELYFNLILEKKKCYIKGKDIADGIIAVVDKLVLHIKKEKASLSQYGEFLDLELQEIKRQLEESGVERPIFHPKYVKFKENKNIIEMLVAKTGDILELKKILDEVFDDAEAHKQTSEDFNKTRIMLSTIHKSKGLETNRVFILRKELIPSKYAQQPWQFVQEENLKFVMITRAKKELVYINDF